MGGQNWGPQYKQIRWMLPDMSHTPGSLWLKTKRHKNNVQTAIQWKEPRRILLITTPGISQHASSPLNGRNHVMTVNSGQHAKEITKLSVICTTTDTNMLCGAQTQAHVNESIRFKFKSTAYHVTGTHTHTHTHTQRQKTQWSLQENTPIRSRRMINADTHDD